MSQLFVRVVRCENTTETLTQFTQLYKWVPEVDIWTNSLRAVTAAWLNASKEWSVKHFEKSQGQDTALCKNAPFNGMKLWRLRQVWSVMNSGYSCMNRLANKGTDKKVTRGRQRMQAEKVKWWYTNTKYTLYLTNSSFPQGVMDQLNSLIKLNATTKPTWTYTMKITVRVDLFVVCVGMTKIMNTMKIWAYYVCTAFFSRQMTTYWHTIPRNNLRG